MANLDAASGMSPMRNPAGTAPKVRPFTCTAVEVFKGDLMQLNASGVAEPVSGTVGAGDNYLLGAAAHHKPAADTTMHIYYDPDQEYTMQTQDALVASLADYQGNNFQVLGANTGTAATGISLMEINGSSKAVTATLPLKALDIYKGIDNALGANVVLVVKINTGKHAFDIALGI